MNNNSVFDQLQGTLREMVVTGEKVGATPELYGALAHSSGLFQQVKTMVLGESDYIVRLTGESWRVVTSGLDHVLDLIDDSDFTPPVTGQCRIHLIRLNEPSPQRALARINQRGFRPASNYELVSLGQQYPDLQRWYKIIAPRMHGGVLVLQTSDELRGSGPERVLYKYNIWRGWNSPEIRFAVV